MNGNDRKLLKEIFTHTAEIKTLKKDVKEVKEIVNKPVFIRLLDDAELHLGDQESLMKKLGQSYGYNKKFSGWDLMDKGFEKLAIELERRNSFINSILHATAFKVVKYIVAIIVVLVLFFRG
jgi:hypothetical protein